MSEEESEYPYDVPMDLPDEKPPKRPRIRIKTIYVVGLIFLVILVLVGWKLLSSKNNPTPSSSPPPGQTSQPEEATTDVPDSTGQKEYVSDQLGVTLNYPNTWKTKEGADDVRLESPDFKYQTVSQGVVAGNFKIYIRLGARSEDGKYIGRGVAIKPSDKLTYSDPLPGQRKTTLLSSFGLDKSNNFAFFMIAGNFDLKKGDTLGPDYGTEVDAFIITGGYSSSALKD